MCGILICFGPTALAGSMAVSKTTSHIANVLPNVRHQEHSTLYSQRILNSLGASGKAYMRCLSLFRPTQSSRRSEKQQIYLNHIAGQKYNLQMNLRHVMECPKPGRKSWVKNLGGKLGYSKAPLHIGGIRKPPHMLRKDPCSVKT